jgi:hypothetical protein
MSMQRLSHHRVRALLALVTCLAVLVAALGPLGTPRAASAPLLTLEPDRGPCAEPVTAREPGPLIVARGQGFPAGRIVILLVQQQSAGQASESTRVTTAADGTFVAQVRVLGCGPETRGGTEFYIRALLGSEGRGNPEPELTRATFTKTASAGQPACFAETGQCIQGRFLAYWQSNGGLARNGLPLSGEFRQVLEDGRAYTVQYFERVRLEYHPENAGTEYEVLLGQFGRRVFRARLGVEVDPPAAPEAGAVYFPETGHNLGRLFLAYWERNGGLAQFGYPLSEEFYETLEDGNTYVVQYFERARFEYHPENAAPFDVLLGQFGRQVLAEAVR